MKTFCGCKGDFCDDRFIMYAIGLLFLKRSHVFFLKRKKVSRKSHLCEIFLFTELSFNTCSRDWRVDGIKYSIIAISYKYKSFFGCKQQFLNLFGTIASTNRRFSVPNAREILRHTARGYYYLFMIRIIKWEKCMFYYFIYAWF